MNAALERSCKPSKALIEAANAYHRRHAFDAFGIVGAARLSVDVPAVLPNEAADDGHIAGINAATGQTTCFRRRTPLAVVFCDPEVAVVGRRFAEHMAHLLALAIERELTVQDLLRMPIYHPVFEEGLRSALRGFSPRLAHGDVSDLASCDGYGVQALD